MRNPNSSQKKPKTIPSANPVPVSVAAPAINKDRLHAHPGCEGIDRETRLLHLAERLRALMEDFIDEANDMSIDVDTPLTVLEQSYCDWIGQDAAYIADFISDQAEIDAPDPVRATFEEMEWSSKLNAAAQGGLLTNASNSVS